MMNKTQDVIVFMGRLVFDLADAGLVMGVSVATAVAALVFPQRRTGAPVLTETAQDEPLALLFDDGFLHHGTKAALAHLSLSPGDHFWADMRDQLVDRFPDLPEEPASDGQGNMTLCARHGSGPQMIDLRWQGPLCWITLSPPDTTPEGQPAKDLVALRLNSATSPHPSWQLDKDGHLIWSNDAYRKLATKSAQDDTQSQPSLFTIPPHRKPHRQTLRFGPEAQPDHYRIIATEQDGVTACHATNINALVQAEHARLNFVQTLTKTFAHLPTGLAIFDRNEQLALFNPALVDLSGLSGAFLSGQPTMVSFFDQLRENRRMPEPKNYALWRDEIGTLIRAASDDGYQETWSLEDGRTYHVQGRPHPDGATAFLIDDITAEIMITRNFRKELEIGQSLLDNVEDAFVVFSRAGVLTFCNAVYRDLWGHDPESAFADVTIHDSIRVWRDIVDGETDWTGIEAFVMSFEDPEPARLNTIDINGASYSCQMRTIAPGARMVQFSARQTRPKRGKSNLKADAGSV